MKDVTDTAGYRNFIVCKQVMKKIDFQGRYGKNIELAKCI